MDKASQPGKEKTRFIPLFQTGEHNRLPNPISRKKSQPLDGEHNRLPNPISRKKSQPLDGEHNRLPNPISRKKSQPLDGEHNRLPNPISRKKSRPLDGKHNRLPNPISRKKSQPLDGEHNRLPNPISRKKSQPLEGKGQEVTTAAGHKKAGDEENKQGQKMKKTREKRETSGEDEYEEMFARVLADASPVLKEELQTTVQHRTQRNQHDEQRDTDEEYYDQWVQCDVCDKWRRLKSGSDPSELPRDWTCFLNTDEQYSSCSVPEDQGSGDEENNVTTSLWPGCLVWARQTGYPWWPALVERDPDTNKYFHFTGRTNIKPCRYHVTYLGQPVSRAWLSCGRIQPFSSLTLEQAITMPSQQRHMEKLKKAVVMAAQVQKETLMRRLDMFGFLSRFVSDKETSDDSDLAEAPDEFLDSHNVSRKQTNNKTKDGSSKQKGRQRKRREGERDENKSCRMEEVKKRRRERECGGLEDEDSQ